MNVYMSPDGDGGAVASVHKALLLSALTINATTLDASTYGSGNQATVYRLANETIDGTGAGSVISLGAVSVGVYSQALQNIATLRAQNGASMSMLEYGYDSLSKQKNNLNAGRGRIMDVGIWRRKAHVCPSTIFWYKPPLLCFRKPMHFLRYHLS